MDYEEERKYLHYFGEVPKTRKEQTEMNARIDEIEREEYENIQSREQEMMENTFRSRFGRLPRNSAEEDAFLQQLRDDEEEEREAYYREEEAYRREQDQKYKLEQLHTYHPNLNMTMAEELQRVLGHPVPLKRYVRKQKKAGVPFEQAVENYAQGGPAVEGVGKGSSRNLYPNAPKVIKKQNAWNLGLIPDPRYKNRKPDPMYKNTPPPANNEYNTPASGSSGTRRRKRRGGRRRARTAKK